MKVNFNKIQKSYNKEVKEKIIENARERKVFSRSLEVYPRTFFNAETIIEELKIPRADKTLLYDIIDELEQYASECLSKEVNVRIPYTVNVIFKDIPRLMKEKKQILKVASHSMTSEEYQELYRETIKEADEEIRKNKKRRQLYTLIRPKRSVMNEISAKGIHYREFWFYSRSEFSVIKFDEEVQEAYDRLDNIDRNNIEDDGLNEY